MRKSGVEFIEGRNGELFGTFPLGGFLSTTIDEEKAPQPVSREEESRRLFELLRRLSNEQQTQLNLQNAQSAADLHFLDDAQRRRIKQLFDEQVAAAKQAQDERNKCQKCGGLPNKSSLYFEECGDKPALIAHLGCVEVVKRSEVPPRFHNMCRQAAGGSMMGNTWYYLLQEDVDAATKEEREEQKKARASMTPAEKNLDTLEQWLVEKRDLRRVTKKEADKCMYRKNGYSQKPKLDAKIEKLDAEIKELREKIKEAKKEVKQQKKTKKPASGKAKQTTGAKRQRKVVNDDDDYSP